MRLLQDRQAHTTIEMPDPRERKVLRSLRHAVRQSVGEGEEVQLDRLSARLECPETTREEERV
jgi:hypothetical protein